MNITEQEKLARLEIIKTRWLKLQAKKKQLEEKIIEEQEENSRRKEQNYLGSPDKDYISIKPRKVY